MVMRPSPSPTSSTPFSRGRTTRPNRRTGPIRVIGEDPGNGASLGQVQKGLNPAKFLRGLVKPIAILALLGGLVYGGLLAHRFVVQSPHFHVRRIDVTPTVHVTAEEIRTLAQIGPRRNIFSVNLGEVAARIRRHPWVASVTAYRRLPNTLRLEVREHEAAAAVLVEGDASAESRFYLVSAEGRPFKAATPSELEGLPLVTGVTRTEYRQRGAAVATRLRAAVAAHRAYVAVPGRPRIGEVHGDPVDGVTFYTAERTVQLRMGRGAIGPKLPRLDRVLTELAGRGVRPAIVRLDDERNPRRVTVRLAEADPAP
jgi:cell division septal protein FtsQ